MNLRLPDKLLHKVWIFFLACWYCGSLGLEWDFNGFQYEFNRISIEFQWDCCSSSVTLLCAAWFTGPGPPKTEVPAVPAVPSVVAAVPAVAPAVVSVAPMVATLTSLILFGLWTVDCLRLELHWCHQPSVFPFGTTRFWLVRRWGAVLAAIFLPKTSPNLERQLLPLLELKESCLDFGCWFQATCNLGLWTLQKMRPCMLSPEQFHAWQQLAT